MNNSYEVPKSANQINRKLGVFDRKLEGSHFMFINVILIDIGKRKSICSRINQTKTGVRIIDHFLYIIEEAAKLKTSIAEPA